MTRVSASIILTLFILTLLLLSTDLFAARGDSNLNVTQGDTRKDFQKKLISDFDQQAIELIEWVTQEMGKEILTYREISPGSLPKEVKITAKPTEWGRLLGLIYKKQHGPFKTPEEIMQVAGIGPKTYEANKDRIVVK